ncbi:monooxygenase [Astrocystis sublimbata]|nr:monooxygenase [Astrocystis sublimbata]
MSPPSTSTSPAPIAIIGGGPCGLTLARLLHNAGIPYTIYERDASSQPQGHHQGGSLDIHRENGQAALEAAGLLEEFNKYARYEAEVFTVQDYRGENRFREGEAEGGVEGKEQGFSEGNGRPEIDRAQLRKLLLDSVPQERIQWNKVLKSVERKEGEGVEGAAGYVLRFADGSEESGFRLVVGADGAWSKVRPLITPTKPHYSGKFYIEGRIHPSNPQYAAARDLAGPGLSATCGAGRLLIIQQLSDLSYRVYGGVQDDESCIRPGGDLHLDFSSSDSDIEKVRTALLSRFEAFAPHVRQFLVKAEGPWRAWPLYYLPAETFTLASEGGSWRRAPGVVLVGDAAHVALPSGEGVNLAMFDALRLFQCLTAELAKEGEVYDVKSDAAAIERAIVIYEAEMHKKSAEEVVESISMNNMMFSEDGAQRMTEFFKQFAT